MKIIGTNFIQDSEGPITNGLEFLSFTLQSLLVDVNPYPFSNLKLMINPVLVMSSFILCLTFLQLFPDCLVYLLEPLDELAGSVLCSFFIHIDISTSSPKEALVGTKFFSQKVNSEWTNVKIGCTHVVHRVHVHPITLDACCSHLQEKVPLFSLPPLFVHQYVDGKQCSSLIWCSSSSTI
jgi:hypothetical protein